MSIEMKNQIRPLYSEFQGYLSQAPTSSGGSHTIYDEDMWNQYNDALKLLSKVAEKDYDRFRISPKPSSRSSSLYVPTDIYRQKIGGLISNLHGEYFSDETPPFSGMPSTVITQTQQQSVSVQILLDIQRKIDEILPKVESGSKEESFLKKLKSILSSISNVNQLVSQFMKLAHECGLNVQGILSMWGG